MLERAAPSNEWFERSAPTRLHVARWGLLLALASALAGPGATLADELIYANVAAWSGPVESTQGIALGDIDGDGALDLVRGNLLEPPSLYLNVGGRFAATPAWRGLGDKTRAIALGDVDGDGDLDLVCGNYAPGPTLYLNTGAGFAADTSWTGVPESVYAVALADVDGDGDLDLICGNAGQNSSLYLNTGGTFARVPIRVGPRETTYAIALGDVDGDGDLDLVRGNLGFPATLYLNVGGAFAPAPAWHGLPENTRSVALGDVDNDGDLDLVRGNDGMGPTLYLNSGAVFDTVPAWTGPAESTHGAALGDVDGDGWLDLLLGNANQAATLYRNTGGGFEAAASWRGPPENSGSVALGDIDGDGDLDLVRGNRDQAATLYANISGAFDPAPAWSAPPAHTTSVALGDADGDGDLDLVRGNAGEAIVLLHNLGGRFDADSVSIGPVENTYAVALGDVDGDGRLDLVRGNQSQTASLSLNHGGLFASPSIRFGAPERTQSVVLGDVDGDGDLDLVRGNGNAPATLYRNAGGRFDSTAAWSGPVDDTRGVALGDVDGDGDLDLVSGSFGGPASLYRNAGGSFTPAAVWQGPAENTYAVALGDMDGDGRLDLVRGNSVTDRSTKYRNSGAEFAPAPDWQGPREESQAVALGDVDGDGDLDLIRGNRGAGATLYLNDAGALALAPAWTGPVEQTRAVALGDIDRDGDLDLIRGNDGSSPQPLTLLLNRSPWVLADSGAPRARLANNPAHLRQVRAVPDVDPNRWRISFRGVDLESDPLWVVGEYQLEGSPVWYPMRLDGARRAGPFSTSAGGTSHELVWDVLDLPFGRRDFVIRLRTPSAPRRSGIVQFVPSYLLEVGPIRPVRPAIAISAATLDFGAVTLGDSARLDLRVSNPGARDLVIGRIASSSPEVTVSDSQMIVAPGQERSLVVALGPRGGLVSGDRLWIESNDPVAPVVEIPIVADVRPLVFSVQVLTIGDDLPLGEAVTVLATPAPLVRLLAGMLVYRPAGSGPGFADTIALADAPGGGAPGAPLVGIIPGDAVTESGLEFYVRIDNHGIEATVPVGAPAATLARSVRRPDAITSAVQTDAQGRTPEGRATPVTVSLPRGAIFADGFLYYRPGGAAAYDSVALGLAEVAPGRFAPAAAIPESAVTERGLEYRVRVRSATRTLWDPPCDDSVVTCSAVSAAKRTVRVDVANLAEDRAHAGMRYRMISIPLELDLGGGSTLEAILSDQMGPYDPVRWRSYRYDPEMSAYLEIPDAGIAQGQLVPRPGRGFWLVARSEHRIDTQPVPGRSTPTHAPYRIPLGPGWNQIGDPFSFPVAWQDVSAESSGVPIVLEPPVAWNEAAGSYDAMDVNVLEPFEGYWLFNPHAGPVDLLVPPQAAAAVAPAIVTRRDRARASVADLAEPPESAAWRIHVTATRAGLSDLGNQAGVASLAVEGRDRLDRTEPPLAPGPSISLYFLAEQRGGQRRSVDIRPMIPEHGDQRTRGRRWVFDVAGAGFGAEPAEVSLVFAGLEDVPADLEARLIDRSTSRVVDLRRQTAYAFAATRWGFVDDPAAGRFELRIGTLGYVEDDRPTAGVHETRLLPIRPNPIVAAGVLRFETAARGRVMLGIFDVSGRRLRTLVDGDVDAGPHEIVWSGQDDRGRALASGVYLVRLVTADRTSTRKLIKTR